MPVGRHTVTWNGTDEGGARVPGGVYFVRVRLGGEIQQHRVIFLGK
jgi:flagellar hook assembly protein FlgD